MAKNEGLLLRAYSVAILLLFALVENRALAQQEMDEVASEFESSLSCGHRIWREEEVESLTGAVISYAPHIASNPRIAGTIGGVRQRTTLGYDGGLVFGPIPVNHRQIDYYGIQASGDLVRGWEFVLHTKYSALRIDVSPFWILLVDEIGICQT